MSNGVVTKDLFSQKDITYPELFDALCFNNKKATEEYRSLKLQICKQMSDWKETNIHHRFIQYIKSKNIPILTTNYDSTLLDESIIKFHKMLKRPSINGFPAPIRKSEHMFTDYYPWYSYYSDHIIKDVKEEFGIWHIHGFHCYPRSLVIGAIDYANTIHRLKKYLPVTNQGPKPKWIAKNSWIDIFFNCDLIIIGLSLEPQEISLRWLLMEREKHFRRNEKMRRNTVYINNQQYDCCGKGKKYLFDSLKIDTYTLKTGIDIYQNFEFDHFINYKKCGG